MKDAPRPFYLNLRILLESSNLIHFLIHISQETGVVSVHYTDMETR
jgi:hypothetical protein